MKPTHDDNTPVSQRGRVELTPIPLLDKPLDERMRPVRTYPAERLVRFGDRTRKKLAKGRGIVPILDGVRATEGHRRPGGDDLIFQDVCDAPPSTTISNDGGAIINHVPLQLLFWGSWWNGTPTPSIGQVINAVNSMLQGPY